MLLWKITWTFHTIKIYILLVVYIDDIVIIRDNVHEICDLVIYNRSFIPKIWSLMTVFTGILIARSKKEKLSQQKYVLDMLREAVMLGCKTWDTLSEIVIRLGLLLEDHGRYRRLVRKLIYLAMTWLDMYRLLLWVISCKFHERVIGMLWSNTLRNFVFRSWVIYSHNWFLGSWLDRLSNLDV